MKEQRDERDYPRAENLEHMSQHMQKHEQTCVSCSYLKQCGFKTRCVEYYNMQEIETFWRKRIEVQQ